MFANKIFLSVRLGDTAIEYQVMYLLLQSCAGREYYLLRYVAAELTYIRLGDRYLTHSQVPSLLSRTMPGKFSRALLWISLRFKHKFEVPPLFRWYNYSQSSENTFLNQYNCSQNIFDIFIIDDL